MIAMRKQSKPRQSAVPSTEELDTMSSRQLECALKSLIPVILEHAYTAAYAIHRLASRKDFQTEHGGHPLSARRYLDRYAGALALTGEDMWRMIEYFPNKQDWQRDGKYAGRLDVLRDNSLKLWEQKKRPGNPNGRGRTPMQQPTKGEVIADHNKLKSRFQVVASKLKQISDLTPNKNCGGCKRLTAEKLDLQEENQRLKRHIKTLEDRLAGKRRVKMSA